MNIGIGFNAKDLKRVGWTFIMAAVGAGWVLAAGVSQAPNLRTSRAAWAGVVIGAVAAGISAVKNFVLADTSALK